MAAATMGAIRRAVSAGGTGSRQQLPARAQQPMKTHRRRCVHVQTCARALAKSFIAVVQAVEVCTQDEQGG